MKIVITESQLKTLISDGVGDKYAENQFHIPNTVDNYTNPIPDHDIVATIINGNPIIKNPSDPNSIGQYARGIIDKDGNLYMEKEGRNVHAEIIAHFSREGLINYKYTPDSRWFYMSPDELGFITVITGHPNTYPPTAIKDIFIGTSHNDWISDHGRSEAILLFKKFMDRAKIKNPNFNFIPKTF